MRLDKRRKKYFFRCGMGFHTMKENVCVNCKTTQEQIDEKEKKED